MITKFLSTHTLPMVLLSWVILIGYTTYSQDLQILDDAECTEVKLDGNKFLTNHPHYLRLSRKLREIGKCYMESKDFRLFQEEFQITNVANEEYPEIFFLLRYAESQSRPDKQIWCNMLEVMNREQKERLIDILTHEIIAVIGINKQAESKEIKTTQAIEKINKGEMSPLIPVIHDNRVHFVHKIDSVTVTDYYYSEKLHRRDIMPILVSEDFMSYLIGYEEDFQYAIDEYSKLLLQYNLTGWSRLYADNSRFCYTWYKYILGKYYDEVYSPEILVELKLVAKLFKGSDYEAEIYFDLRNVLQANELFVNMDYKAAYSLIVEDYDFPTSTGELAYKMTEIPLYEHALGQEACQQLIDSFYVGFNKNNLEFNSAGNELILLDFVSTLTRSDKVNEIVASLKLDYKKAISENDYSSSQWNLFLNEYYLNGKLNHHLTVDEVYSLIATFQIKHPDKNYGATDELFVQFAVGYLISQLNYNKFDFDNLINIIDHCQYLFARDNSSTLFYIQNYMIECLDIVIMEKKATRNSVDKYALIIGISDYENLNQVGENINGSDLSDLKFASKDAQDMSQMLSEGPIIDDNWNKVVLLDSMANLSNVRESFKEVFNNAHEDDIIFIYFSGHAQFNEIGQLFLLTYDHEAKDIESNISRTWLDGYVLKSRCNKVFVFIDACNSGALSHSLIKGRSERSVILEDEMKKHGGQKYILTSSGSNENSAEYDELQNGLFTHYLLKAFYGESEDTNGNLFTDTDEMELYITNKMLAFTRINRLPKQQPRVLSSTSSCFPIANR